MSIPRAAAPRASALACALTLILAAGCGPGVPPTADGPEPEQVQIGYGSADRDALTASVASISAEEIDRRRASHVEELLEGVPGVSVIRRGGGFSLRIRGSSSVLASNEPLVVIDGIPVPAYSIAGAFAGILPKDVARIDVIKGASASMYGSRGANGVILIITRR